MADFWITFKKAPNSTLQGINSIKGISAIRSRIVFPVIVDLPNVNFPLSGDVIPMPAEKTPVINNIVLRRGSYFTNDKLNEVIVS